MIIPIFAIPQELSTYSKREMKEKNITTLNNREGGSDVLARGLTVPVSIIHHGVAGTQT